MSPPSGVSVELMWFLLLSAVGLFGTVCSILLGFVVWYAKMMHSWIKVHDKSISALEANYAGITGGLREFQGRVDIMHKENKDAIEALERSVMSALNMRGPR